MPESVTDRPTRAHEYLFLLTKSARYFYDADAIREPHESGEHHFQFDQRKYVGQGTKRAEKVQRGMVKPGAWANGPNPAGRNRRSVWEIATAPYPEAHFATFPPKLVEPCILAGTSPKACGRCGAPYERMTARDGQTAREKLGARGPAAYADAQPTNPQGLDYTGGHGNNMREVRTLGWAHVCGHRDDSGRSLVLDPFCGSGTTGVVALRHDRSFIGIELNESYCELARNRIMDDAPLMNYQLEVASSGSEGGERS